MSGLFHTLNVGSEALHATRQGVDTAGHNIANAQTEGFSRQRVNIKQRDPLFIHGSLIGNGVYVGGIERSHDKFIERQLNKAHQDAGRANARAAGLRNIENIFSPELNASVADEVTKFFGAFESLANFPEDFVVRTSVVESAKDLAAAFRRVDSDLSGNQAAVNEHIGQITGELTDKLKEISTLNVKIQVAEAGEGQQANDLRDQRDKLLREVSSQIEVSYYEDQHGMLMMRGPDQVTLVDGAHSAIVGVAKDPNNDGLFAIHITDWEGHSNRDVTHRMDGGALHALITLRDEDLPALMARNDHMAYRFSESFNSIHREGFGLRDYAEKTGRNFFKQPVGEKGAAAIMELDDCIVESNDAVAAGSSPLAPGDNVNINRLLKLKDAKIYGDSAVTANEFYANYAGALGLDVLRASHLEEASDLQLQDLNQRREAVSGVSLDEEATNMMKWQANFTASSKVITTVDEMLDTVLSLKR
ncbi:flagellar hook junction protein [Planctomyces bekefii]|uniref:Flagellar hook-associated protein 1 n=1 Tax=Planctomyces bekefii TaxID=1653850 RepID=A0A5C6MBU4_9PLAN|nr:flagellar hook junction protein [Planctomyces bekefii]